MPTPPAAHPAPLLIACLCAQWCGSCRDYRATFDAVASEFPQARFEWIDIEDQAELVDPIEVENFPTLLIACGAEPRFFGAITPHKETLARLVRAHAEGAGAGGLGDPALHGVVARLIRA